jgi:tetratricopeptide (TPR) repeat protein
MELGKTEDAEKAYNEAIDIDPNNPVYQNDLGKAYEMDGDYQRAAEQYLKAIHLNPEAKEYLSNLISVCGRLIDLDKAISLLEAASKILPDSTEIAQVIERLKK